ncbi:hypothetical protein FHG87_009527 [Trinorchestia longiramus]|nr:hypothetical protein FHG87_009527 [Trinorchestia longiramus]
MFGVNVMAWNGGDLEKLEVLQNRVGRLALDAPKWTAAEALRRALGCSLFSERMVKAVLNYKCIRGVEETVEYLVLECSKYEHEQESLMAVVHEQCGENKWNARHFWRYLMGFSNLDEPQAILLELLGCMRRSSYAHYTVMLQRLRQVPVQLDQLQSLMIVGLQKGITLHAVGLVGIT